MRAAFTTGCLHGGHGESARRRGDGGPGWSLALPAPRAPSASPSPSRPRLCAPPPAPPPRRGPAGGREIGGREERSVGPGARPALGAWEPRRGAARPGEEGAEVSGLGDSPGLEDRPGSPCSRILPPGLGGRLAGQVGGGRGAERRPWHPFRPLLPAVLPEPRGSPQVGPSRKEARRDLVPGRMCPKGKGPAGYFYPSLWVDAALFHC